MKFYSGLQTQNHCYNDFYFIGELLVLHLGETIDIPCTAPDEEYLNINWLVECLNGSSEDIQIEDTFIQQNGLKQRNITFTATLETNNTNLDCGIYNHREPSSSYSPLKFSVLVQG